MGGQDGKGKTLASVERLNLSLLASSDCCWEPCANLKHPRHQFAVTATSTGIIVVAGGCNDTEGRLSTVECFLHTQQNDQEWTPLPSLQTPRMGGSLSILNNRIFVAGGTKTPGPFWGTGNLETIETLDILASVVSQPVNTTITTTTTAPTTPPVAHAQLLVDEEEDTHGFIPVVNAPSTAPTHWHQPVSVASIPVAHAHADVNHQQEQQAQQQSSSSSSLTTPLPTAIPPPQDKTQAQLQTHSQLDALPPPILPPQAKAAVTQQEQVERSEDDMSCAVCLERKKQVAFFCGHQVCLVCSPSLQHCHICRKQIQGRIQLYDD